MVGASEPASKLGIRPGMTLAQARALHAGLVQVEQDPERDEPALLSMARWLLRFSPVVSTSTLVQPEHEGDEGVYVDLTGSQRLLGPSTEVAGRIVSTIRRMGFQACMGMDHTPAAAWVRTFLPSGYEHSPAPTDDAPVSSLRLDRETVELLRQLGVCTIGQLLRLPRQQLPARFSPLLLQRIGQFSGLIYEPLVPISALSPITSRVDFESSVESLEILWRTLESMLDEIIANLAKRGRGVRSLEAQFLLPDSPAVRKTLDLSRATRDRGSLHRLLRCALETQLQTPHVTRAHGRWVDYDPPSDGVTRRRRYYLPPNGFSGIRLHALRTEPLGHDQPALLAQADDEARREVEELVERIRVRLGRESIVQPELLESHLPEKSWTTSRREGRNIAPRAHSPDRLADRMVNLHPPVPIRVIVSPSDLRDGRPVWMQHEGRDSRIVHAVGPQRISGLWWENHVKTRDYFDVEDETGRRLCIFRVNESGAWFAQGG